MHFHESHSERHFSLDGRRLMEAQAHRREAASRRDAMVFLQAWGDARGPALASYLAALVAEEAAGRRWRDSPDALPRRPGYLPEGRMCGTHLHSPPLSRYDHAAKRLELLLTCPVCETEKVIHSLANEPRFEPSVASVHALHPPMGAAADALARAA